VSVDPLVTMTGEPYIYAGGNTVTYSDPTGLERCPLAGCNVDEHGRDAGRGGAGNPRGGDYGRNGNTSQRNQPPPGQGPPESSSDYVCGPSSGAATSRTEGQCGWTASNDGVPRLTGPDFSVFDVLPREVVEFAKGFGVAIAAVGTAVAICSTGVGCIIVVGAVAGPGYNIIAEEGIDCAYGDCGSITREELLGDGLEGVVIGGTSGYVRTKLSIQLGASQPAIGSLEAAQQYGLPATAGALTAAAQEQAWSNLLKQVINETFGP